MNEDGDWSCDQAVQAEDVEQGSIPYTTMKDLEEEVEDVDEDVDEEEIRKLPSFRYGGPDVDDIRRGVLDLKRKRRRGPGGRKVRERRVLSPFLFPPFKNLSPFGMMIVRREREADEGKKRGQKILFLDHKSAYDDEILHL
jgi:hypothetical protein